ncbi:MAG: sialate O-acetylesterase [Armatimonadetes bacterium]|nr:sialate O-acetylesterase [Armatimonadota bacterium]
MASSFEGRLATPAPCQVFQRDREGKADIRLAGRLPLEAGSVEARLLHQEAPVPGFDWAAAGGIRGGQMNGAVRQVPTGGEYTLEIRFRDESGRIHGAASVPHLLVGDLWVLAGQSNMDGIGKLFDTEPPSPMVHCFYYDDRWAAAEDPLCWYNEAVDPIHWGVPEEQREQAIITDRYFRSAGAGLGVSFGTHMYGHTGVPVGLLICSHGGTSMEQWSPAHREMEGRSLYGSMMRRIGAVGGRVKGCVWYQGESDALTPEAAPVYRAKFRGFIETMRRDLDDSEMPFLYVQLASFYDWNPCPHWNDVQNDQLLLESDLPNVGMVAAIDATLSDAIHVDTLSLRRLGARLADVAQILCFGNSTLKRGPRPQAFAFEDSARTVFRVAYREVNGRLKSAPKIWGFSVEKDGQPLPIASCEVDESSPGSVLIRFVEPVPEGALLWYGRGLNPVCNLKDARGFAAPVFGPVGI